MKYDLKKLKLEARRLRIYCTNSHRAGVWCWKLCLLIAIYCAFNALFTAQHYASAVCRPSVVLRPPVLPSVYPPFCHKSELHRNG